MLTIGGQISIGLALQMLQVQRHRIERSCYLANFISAQYFDLLSGTPVRDRFGGISQQQQLARQKRAEDKRENRHQHDFGARQADRRPGRTEQQFVDIMRGKAQFYVAVGAFVNLDFALNIKHFIGYRVIGQIRRTARFEQHRVTVLRQHYPVTGYPCVNHIRDL